MLIDADEEELFDIFIAMEPPAQVTKPQRKKFKRELAKLRGKEEQF